MDIEETTQINPGAAKEKPLEFRQVCLERILPLRARVLRPGRPKREAIFEGDFATRSRHFAVVLGGQVVSCASIVPSRMGCRPAWQLRAVATDPDFRRQGFAGRLLQTIEETICSTSAVRLIWCSARTSAIGFYRKFGWQVCSEPYHKAGVGWHRNMVKRAGTARHA